MKIINVKLEWADGEIVEKQFTESEFEKVSINDSRWLKNLPNKTMFVWKVLGYYPVEQPIRITIN